MVPASKLKMTSDVVAVITPEAGVVAVWGPTARGPLYSPTYITTKAQYYKYFGGELATSSFPSQCLEMLDKGAKLMIGRVTNLLNQDLPLVQSNSAKTVLTLGLEQAPTVPSSITSTIQVVSTLGAPRAVTFTIGGPNGWELYRTTFMVPAPGAATDIIAALATSITASPLPVGYTIAYNGISFTVTRAGGQEGGRIGLFQGSDVTPYSFFLNQSSLAFVAGPVTPAVPVTPSTFTQSYVEPTSEITLSFRIIVSGVSVYFADIPYIGERTIALSLTALQTYIASNPLPNGYSITFTPNGLTVTRADGINVGTVSFFWMGTYNIVRGNPSAAFEGGVPGTTPSTFTQTYSHMLVDATILYVMESSTGIWEFSRSFEFRGHLTPASVMVALGNFLLVNPMPSGQTITFNPTGNGFTITRPDGLNGGRVRVYLPGSVDPSYLGFVPTDPTATYVGGAPGTPAIVTPSTLTHTVGVISAPEGTRTGSFALQGPNGASIYNNVFAVISPGAPADVITGITAMIQANPLPVGYTLTSTGATFLITRQSGEVGGQVVLSINPSSVSYSASTTTPSAQFAGGTVPTPSTVIRLTSKGPEALDSTGVDYFFNILTAKSGVAGTFDVEIGDVNYPSLMSVIVDVPTTITATEIGRFNAENDYFDFSLVGGALTTSLRLLSIPSIRLGAQIGVAVIPGSYNVSAITPTDYIGSRIGLTGVNMFLGTKVPDVYATPSIVDNSVDLAVHTYLKDIQSVNGEYGFMAFHVIQAGSATSTIRGAVDYVTALDVQSPITIPLGGGSRVKLASGGISTVSNITDYLAAWSRQGLDAPNYLPAGEYNGRITGKIGPTYDITSDAQAADADAAYKKGINFAKIDPILGYVFWGIRTLGTGAWLQGTVGRTTMFIKRGIKAIDTTGMFGPNVATAAGYLRRRDAIIAVLERTKQTGAIQSYTYLDGVDLPVDVIQPDNAYTYQFTYIPIFSTEQIQGTGILTTETNTVNFL